MIQCVVRLATDRGIAFHLTPRAVERKLRLFYCACCRLFWDRLPGPARSAVEAAERHAHGLANARHLRDARRAAQGAERATWPVPQAGGYAPGAWDVSHAVRLAVTATEFHVRVPSRVVPDGSPAGAAEQAALLREVFENPFRPVAIEAAWLTPNALTLAHVIQIERAFDLMPVLGDALRDAGCECAEVVEHCYGSGPHTAGCWLIDRLTGWVAG